MPSREAREPGSDDDFATSTLAALEWNADDREDNWLISYADLLSVIFAMVVLLLGRLTVVGATPADPRVAVEPEPAVAASVSVSAPSDAVRRSAGALNREDRVAALIEQRFHGQIAAERRENGLQVTIPEVALFDTGRAVLQESARPVLAELAATLREGGETRISVEGHTDNVPVQGGQFASNWDLASARANVVARYLLEHGFEPAHLQSVSFADTRPVAGNDSEAGRAANRRVELQIGFIDDSRRSQEAALVTVR
jgi:chemotaxis protein MotB